MFNEIYIIYQTSAQSLIPEQPQHILYSETVKMLSYWCSVVIKYSCIRMTKHRREKQVMTKSECYSWFILPPSIETFLTFFFNRIFPKINIAEIFFDRWVCSCEIIYKSMQYNKKRNQCPCMHQVWSSLVWSMGGGGEREPGRVRQLQNVNENKWRE